MKERTSASAFDSDACAPPQDEPDANVAPDASMSKFDVTPAISAARTAPAATLPPHATGAPSDVREMTASVASASAPIQRCPATMESAQLTLFGHALATPAHASSVSWRIPIVI